MERINKNTVCRSMMMKPLKKASEMTPGELARYIDQSVLKPEFTQEDIKRYILEGIGYGCATVCVNPASLDIAAQLTRGTDTKICVVCDFPFGLSTTESKIAQAELYCRRGDIYELDIVANIGWIRSGCWDRVTDELKKVTQACHKHGTAVKVILETDALTAEQAVRACQCVIAANADFVKTSTGFLTGHNNQGASPEIIEILMTACEGKIKIKGSGGIRTREHFLKLIDMGIDRMGVGYQSTPVVLGLG